MSPPASPAASRADVNTSAAMDDSAMRATGAGRTCGDCIGVTGSCCRPLQPPPSSTLNGSLPTEVVLVEVRTGGGVRAASPNRSQRASWSPLVSRCACTSCSSCSTSSCSPWLSSVEPEPDPCPAPTHPARRPQPTPAG
jgi:hypothetical protein